jgi:F1F0 ATPase subunit 2
MNGDIPSSTITLASGAALAGLALGLVYFHALRRTVELFATGRGRFGPIVLTLGRIAGAFIVLVFMARLGAAALVASFLGFVIAREVAVRRERRSG